MRTGPERVHAVRLTPPPPTTTGTRLSDARSHYGVGAGWYLRVPLLSVNVDVAYGVDSGARVHVTAGLKF